LKAILRCALAAVATTLLQGALSACGGAILQPQPERAEHAPEVQWQSVWGETPALLFVVRPQAIMRDGVYGSLFKSVLRVASAKSEMTGVTALEAAGGCEEIVVGLGQGNAAFVDDAAIVLRGVPANLDPEKMADQVGRPLFRLVRDSVLDAVPDQGGFQELERVDGAATQHGPSSASLFVLPDRTWVVATGLARERARRAFAAPANRVGRAGRVGPTIPTIDSSALAVVRVDRAMLSRPRLERSPAFGPLIRRLSSASLALLSGKGGLVATLTYQSEADAQRAELHAKRLVSELVRDDAASANQAETSETRPLPWDWLKSVEIVRESNLVRMRVAVPPRLLEDLPNARGDDLAF